MIGNFSQRLAILGSCMMVCACSGGGHSVGVSTPPPPTAPTYDSFVGLNKDVSLQTTSTAISYTFTSYNGLDPNSISRDAKGGFGEGGISISYDAASQTYTLHDGTTAISFAPADKDPSAPGPSQTPFDTYVHKQSIGRGSIVDTVSSYRAGAANTQFPQLSYTRFMVARHSATTLRSGISDAVTDNRVIYAIGGFETQRSDLPKMGTATYSTFVTGTAIGSDPTTIDGSATLTADFANASVNTSLSLSYNNASIGTFNGVAPIETTSSHFKGDLTANGTTQGSFSGSFFGPQAAEAGYTFRVLTGLGLVDGGVVGKK